MNLNISDEQMRAIVADAIMKSVGPDTRETLIAEAIKYLLTPPPSNQFSSEKPRSPLQQAFETAIHQIAREEVKVALQEDENIKRQIKELITLAVERLHSMKDESVQEIANVISSRLSRIQDNY